MNDISNEPLVRGNVFNDMQAFHRKYGFHEEELSPKQLVGRLEFLREELDETQQAALDLNSKEVVDGLIDLIVVAAGTLDLLIGPAYASDAWRKVMTANHKKVIGFNEKRPHTEGKDLVKPAGWKAPDLELEAGPLTDLFDNWRDRDRAEEIYNLLYAKPEYIPHPPEPRPDREAAYVLMQCLEILRRKSADYSNTHSTVTPADYYPDGLDDFVYLIDVHKRNRQTSLIDAMKADEMAPINFESLADTLMDRINYLALMVEWIRKQTPGQDKDRDLFNREALA
jgi:hypothetical protein